MRRSPPPLQCPSSASPTGMFPRLPASPTCFCHRLPTPPLAHANTHVQTHMASNFSVGCACPPSPVRNAHVHTHGPFSFKYRRRIHCFCMLCERFCPSCCIACSFFVCSSFFQVFPVTPVAHHLQQIHDQRLEKTLRSRCVSVSVSASVKSIMT